MTSRAIELLALAARVRSGAITARAATRTLDRAKTSETSSRIRHAMRAVGRASRERHALVVARDGRGFATARREHVSLARRKALSRALVLLTERRIAKPGAGVSWQDVLAAAWPGEKVHPEAGFLRVRNALFLLRRLGVGEALLTRDGYLLDPEIDVAWGEI